MTTAASFSFSFLIFAVMGTSRSNMLAATLALLQEADAYARAHDEYEISLANINRAWFALFKQQPEENRMPSDGL